MHEEAQEISRLCRALAVPTAINKRWSTDFVHNRLAESYRFHILNIIENYSCECISLSYQPPSVFENKIA